MFCFNCGKELPDCAKFCIRCGEKTTFPVTTVKKVTVQKTPVSHRPTYDKSQEQQEEVRRMNQNTLKKLQKEFDDLEDKKGTFSAFYIIIAVIAVAFSFAGFASMNGELTEDTLSGMMTGLISAAVALGMFFGTLIYNSKMNRILDEKRRKIERFKIENDVDAEE